MTVRSRGGGVPDRTVDLWLPDQRLDVRVETGVHESPGYQTGAVGYGTNAYGSEVAAG